jgi:hypothetical protein
MNNRIIFNDLLDLWVTKKISLQEIAVQSGKSISEIQEETEQHFIAVKAIEYASIRDQVAAVHTRYTSPTLVQPIQPVKPKVISISRTKWITRIAAGVALFIGLYFVQDSIFMNPEKLYQNNFQEYYINTERSSEVAVSSTMVESFRKSNFKDVLSNYNKLSNPSNKEHFLAGFASLKIYNFQDANKFFNFIISRNNDNKNGNLYQDEAEYYLALTYLKTGNTAEAYQLMKKIYNDPNHTFNESISKWTLMRMRWVK